jgi:rod shape-determining protein MreC
MLLIVNNRSVQSTAIFNSTNAVSANLFNAVASTKEYLSLKEENKKLAEEVAFLHNQLKSSYDILDMQAPQFMKNDSLFRKKYVFHNAQVINSSSNLNKNFLTLNIGSNQGVAKDYAIINSEGIVGVVKDVSPNFCTALSVLHTEQIINCKIKKDGVFGPLSWDGKDFRYAHLMEVPTYSKVMKGDTILTSSLSSIFPEGIMVGIVESVIRKPGEAFYTLTVKLHTDFKKLNYVTVIENKYKMEQDSLEKTLKNSEKKK